MSLAAMKTCHFIVVFFSFYGLSLNLLLQQIVILFWKRLYYRAKPFPLFLGKNLMQRCNSGTDVSNRSALFSKINYAAVVSTTDISLRSRI